MKITTEIHVPPSGHSIRLCDPLLIVGSCFAQEVGAWFQARRFEICLNPNGIVFHPSALANGLRKTIDQHVYTDDDWVEQNGLFHSLDHHGSWSANTREELTHNVNTRRMEVFGYLKTAKTLIVTWGSAWGYRWKKSGQWAANCHKIPQHNFIKELMQADAIVAEWTALLNEFTQINPEIQVVFSVSPVRYWRDGAHGNQLSKAQLLIAASHLAESHANVRYFPAYEIMLDELRDYRFYADDMLHPSPLAVEYIIEKFQGAFFDEKMKAYVAEIERSLKFLQHRPLHAPSAEWESQCAEMESRITLLYNRHK